MSTRQTKVCTERRFVNDPVAITANIVKHMYTRSQIGGVAIVIDRPRIMLSVLRKQWAKTTRDVHRCRASTLDPKKISLLSDEMLRMHQLVFSCELNQRKTDVLILPPESCRHIPNSYKTIYICSDLAQNFEHINGVVVDYRPVSYCGNILTVR